MGAQKGQPVAKRISCNLLAEKNYHLTLPVLSRAAWQQLCRAELEIPRTFSQLQKYARQLLEPRRLKISKTTVPPSIARIATESPEECGEVAWQALFFGLSNLNLRSAQRQTLETEIAACLPKFKCSLSTEHFILRWTTSSPDPDDNISDEQIIAETGAYLEYAWERYSNAFGRSPYVGDSNSGAEAFAWERVNRENELTRTFSVALVADLIEKAS
jgi:hypothetical protein